MALAQAGRMDQAVQAWKKASKLDSDLVAPRFNLALFLSRQGRTGEAVEVLEAIAGPDQENPAVLRLYGELSLTAGAAGLALIAFSEAVRKDRQDTDAIIGLAETRLLRKEFEAARELIDRAAELDPRNPRTALLRAHLQIETFTDAELEGSGVDEPLAQALQDSDLRTQAAYLLGRLRLRQRRFNEAVTLFRLPLDANPRDLNARFMLVRALEGASRTAEARRELTLYDRLFSIQTRIAATRARARVKDDNPELHRKLVALQAQEKRLLDLE